MDMGGNFFNPGPFMPHGGCYLWTQSLILLHALSDGIIVLSYYSIPIILLYFVRHRPDLKFKWVFVCFAAFVLACGTTHLMEIWNIWHANYWLSGFFKALTALISAATTVLLVKLMPAALALPGAEDLRKAHAELEIRVRERTAELSRSQRALRTISDCNQILVRATTEPALLRDICGVIISSGGYRMTWVGFPENDEQKSVRIAAQAGFNEGYLEQARISWDENSERGRGPSGTAIRTGEIAVSHDFQADPATTPWRAAALQRGYGSSIVLPLRTGAKAFGVLTIYSAEANAFQPNEVGLLKELADDLAYGIQTLRTRLAHGLAEQALEASESRMRFLLNSTPAVIYALRAEGDFATTFVSPNIQTVVGYGPEDFIKDPGFWRAHLHPDDLAVIPARSAELAATESITHEYRFHHADGSYRWMHDETRLVRDAQGRPLEFLGYLFDINRRKTMEAQLHESATQLLEAQRTARLGSYRLDVPAGRWTCSDVLDEIFGLAEAGFTKDVAGWLQIVHPQERAELRRYFAEEVLEKRAPFDRAYRIIRLNDHQERWVHGTGKLILDAHGQVAQMVGIIQDITERRQAELALVSERALLRTLVNHLPLAVYLKDAAGRKTLANPADIQNMGLTSEADVLGKTDFDLFPPERAAAFHADDQRVLQTGQPVINHEEKLILPDGTVHWLLTSKVPLFDRHGKVFGLAGVGLDITERKRIAEAHARLATAIEQANETVMITDADGTIVYVNPAFETKTGYSRAEAIGQNPRLIRSDRHDPEFYRQMWEKLKRGEVWRGHLINQRKDGALFEEEATISPMRDEQGAIINYVAVKRDVTREVQLETQFRQTQKMEAIGTLAGGIAHDFNNILGAMFGYANLLQQDTEGNAAAQDSIGEILKAANRAKELVQQILTFSHQREQKRQVIRLDTVVKEATKFLRASLPAQLAIELKLAEDAPSVLADPTQIYQVIMNLATNAQHAMAGRAGTLTFSLDAFQTHEEFLQTHPDFRASQYARLTVADTGHGMDAKTLERIFEPFFTTKPVGQGTGLGLAVVHGIVQSHEGHITVDSQVAHGTTFRLYFPAHTPDPATVETIAGNLVLGRGQRLLLVDDEAALTLSLKRLLARLNYQVTISNSAREALDLFLKNPRDFDLLLTDLTMPEMNGLELAHQFRAVRPDLPILLASGYSATLTPAGLSEAGIREVLQKPVSLASLAEALRRALEPV
jgi:PAS domain S-box-containing protein